LAKLEWGAKHVCESCSLKYYDMQRKPIMCPGCGEKAAVAVVRPRRSRNAVKPEKEAPAKSQQEDAAPAADVDPDEGATVLGLDEDNGKLTVGADNGDDVGLLTDDDDIATKKIIGGGIAADDKEF